MKVDRDTPAAKAGLEDGDLITEVRLQEAVKEEWGAWFKLESERGKEKLYDEWCRSSGSCRGPIRPGWN